MIAWILFFALVMSLLANWIQYEFLRLNEIYEKELRGNIAQERDANIRLIAVNADLREELIRTGTHRDELQARYRDQEADREIKAANQALRSERARKASQARWGKKVAA